jgi:hypothetical protein
VGSIEQRRSAHLGASTVASEANPPQRRGLRRSPVAASLRLAEHLQDGGDTAEDFAAVSGIERSMAVRFLRACTKIGLTTCDDGRTFKSTSRLQTLHGETPGSMRNLAMVLGTPAQYLIWSEFLTAVRTKRSATRQSVGRSDFRLLR